MYPSSPPHFGLFITHTQASRAVSLAPGKYIKRCPHILRGMAHYMDHINVNIVVAHREVVSARILKAKLKESKRHKCLYTRASARVVLSEKGR